MLAPFAIACLSLLAIGAESAANQVSEATPLRQSLAGKWRVTLGPAQLPPLPDEVEGTDATDPLTEPVPDSANAMPVNLPGALRDSGLGPKVDRHTAWIGSGRPQAYRDSRWIPYREPDNFKIPFGWQPERHFVGAAWYERELVIPERWNGYRIFLTLERPHWRTRVWISDQLVGANDSAGTSHVYDVTDFVKPGSHTLRIGVDNGNRFIDLGENSHSISDHTQTAWHGIVGEITLTAKPKIAFGSVRIEPKPASEQVDVRILLTNHTTQSSRVTLSMSVSQNGATLGRSASSVEIPIGGMTIDHTLTLDSAALPWDEFNPHLCKLTAQLTPQLFDESTHLPLATGDPSASPTLDCIVESFGVRQVSVDGTQMKLNGNPLFLRGTLECCVFPLTGYPPTDIDSWKRIIQICKSHGLNHIRFHSWCPPDAAFEAADELGFYYQVECSSWPNQSTSLGSGLSIDRWLEIEGQRVIDAYANHPSFLLLAAGNEAAGGEAAAEYLSKWVSRFRSDGRFLVTSAAGWPLVDESDFHVSTEPRIRPMGEGLLGRINLRRPETTTDYSSVVQSHNAPVIGHEIGQWCAFPNLDEMKKYVGSIQVKNYEIFRDQLAAAGMLHQARDFMLASGKLQALVYKEEIEAALRTPGLGGFQLLDLHDFPGQGTATVGVLDPFWDEKPYTQAAAFRRFCGPIVPLARLPKRVWTNDELLSAAVSLFHHGPVDLTDAQTTWTLSDAASRRVIGSGMIACESINKNSLRTIGDIKVSLASVSTPSKLQLTVRVQSPDLNPEVLVENDWDLWVYPQEITSVDQASCSTDLMTTERLTDEAMEHLQTGGRVLMLPKVESVDSDVTTGMSPIFWNTVWLDNQSPRTLGLLCDPQHPLLSNFPTESHSNWQWWELLNRAGAIDLSRSAMAVEPIIQLVPDWFDPKRLATIFECGVGKGKLLVCSMDISNDLVDRPVARHLRDCILHYMMSDEFAPTVKLTPSDLRQLFFDPPYALHHDVVASASEYADLFPASNVIDGDPSTIWHTPWKPSTPFPHHLTLDLGHSISLDGVRYTPRQGVRNGRISRFQIHLSDDGQVWRLVNTGSWRDSVATRSVRFKRSETTRYVRLTSLSDTEQNGVTSVAEFDVIPTDLPAVSPSIGGTR